MDNSWREEYLEMKVLNKYQISLLKEGAKSLSQAWLLGAMWMDWKKKKGIKEPDTENKGQLQSSFKDWEARINKDR